MVAEFKFRVENYRCFTDSNPLEFTLSGGFVAFVGPNDAGKSSALRFFFEFRDLWSHVGAAGSVWTAIRNGAIVLGGPKNVSDAADVFNDRGHGGIRIRITLVGAINTDVVWLELYIEPNFSVSLSLMTAGGPLGPGNSSVTGTKLTLGMVPYEYGEFTRLFEALSSVMYVPAFRNAINIGSGSYFDLAFGTAFVQTWDAWKNGANKRQRDATIRVENDLRRLLGYDSFAVNASPDKTELRVVVDDRSRNLSEMGAGVSEFLLIIGNLLLRQPKTILIDEPETHLHPIKQIELLRLLLSASSSGLVLFATHSLGLARSVTRNICLVDRNPVTKESRSRSLSGNVSLQEFLGEMNYTAQRELGARKVLFVEGVTDVVAIRHFLRLFDKDHDCVLLPLLGDCLINGKRDSELSELARLEIPCVALLDSERSAPGAPIAGNRTAFLKVWNDLGFKAHVLERRALENYFTERAVKATSASLKALGHYDRPEKHAKALNGRVAVQMTKEDLEGTDLATFITSL